MTLRQLPILVLTSFLFFGSKPLLANSRFAQNKFAQHGNWFASVAIGLGVNQESTEILGNTLRKIFVSSQGGYYTDAVNISDYNTENISVRLLDQEMNHLTQRMQRFRRTNPGKPQRLVIALTGHGIYDPETKGYSFSVSENEKLSGKQLVKVLQRFPVREIVVVVQSCQSGSLVTRNMESFIAELNEEIRIGRPNQRIAVMTPVNRYINSPLDVWEQILEQSFKKASDRNRDSIVTMDEWRYDILEASIANGRYLPKRLLAKFVEFFSQTNMSGVDPQIATHNFPGNTPIFLTRRGVAKLKAGTLEQRPSRIKEHKVKALRKATIGFETEAERLINLLVRGSTTIDEKLAERLEEEFERKLEAVQDRTDPQGRRLRKFLANIFPYAFWGDRKGPYTGTKCVRSTGK